jgi:peptide/nickel transport system substrate-binding protein
MEGERMTRIRARSALAALAAPVVVGLVVVAGATSATPPQLKNGGTLTIGLAEDPDALDPTLARTFVGRIVFLHMCEKLYDLNSKLEIVPQLAAALPTLSADKRTMTIRLRTGVKFNDGTAFDAAAVKKSLERHKTLRGSTRASEIAPVTSIDTQGSNAVVLHMNDRYSPLTAQLADRAGMVMSPKALDELGDRFASGPVCVGPFMYKERQAGDHITLVKSPYYYDRAKVHLGQITFKIITDPSARSQNLRSGDIDVEDRIPSTELRGIASDAKLRVIKSTSIGYQGITLNIGNKNGLGKTYENVGTAIARSADLRQAFELAIDRKVINKVVFGGTNQPDCFPWAPQSPWYAAVKGLPCHLTASMSAARQAFARANASAPVKVKLMIGTDPIAARLGQVIQAMVKPVGFDVDLQPTEFTTSLNRNDAGNYETFAIGWSGRIDPDGNFYQFVNSKGSQNTSGYSNPVVDRATNNARKAATQAARIASYRAAMQQVLKDLPLMYLWHPVNRFGVTKTVGGVQVYGDGLIRAQFAGFKK